MADVRIPIRAARPGDLTALGAIWLEMMEQHAATDPGFALAPAAVAQWKTLASDMLTRSDGFVLLAEHPDDDGPARAVGFCLGWVAKNPPIYQAGNIGFISELAVRHDQRRRGIGASLVRAARQWFAARALGEFQLSTAVWNEAARAFWQAQGGEAFLLRYRFSLNPGATGVVR